MRALHARALALAGGRAALEPEHHRRVTAAFDYQLLAGGGRGGSDERQHGVRAGTSPNAGSRACSSSLGATGVDTSLSFPLPRPELARDARVSACAQSSRHPLPLQSRSALGPCAAVMHCPCVTSLCKQRAAMTRSNPIRQDSSWTLRTCGAALCNVPFGLHRACPSRKFLHGTCI